MPKPYFLVVIAIIFASDFYGTVSADWCGSDDYYGKISLEFQEKINQYRRGLGKPPLTCHWALVKTATTHTENQIDYGKKFEKEIKGYGCNMHSWFGDVLGNAGTPHKVASKCCYDDDHSNPECMWNKPQELSGWGDDNILGGDGNGVEISHGTNKCPTCVRETVDRAIEWWKKSPSHRAVMAGEGYWGTLTKIGCYFENKGASGFANCWFSQ